MNPDKALKLLMEGNKRFVSGEIIHPNLTEERREEVKKGQRPFAVVLTCSDSRTPPEFIFDRGIGDLFVVRTAGNVVGEVGVGSLELAVTECQVPLIMVLGHQYCGAIKLAIEQAGYEGHMDGIMNRIKPAVISVEGEPGKLQDNVAQANVKNVVFQLENSRPILKPLVEQGKLKIVGAYYWMDDGKVELLAKAKKEL
jgi:carbonic anhydrase